MSLSLARVPLTLRRAVSSSFERVHRAAQATIEEIYRTAVDRAADGADRALDRAVRLETKCNERLAAGGEREPFSCKAFQQQLACLMVSRYPLADFTTLFREATEKGDGERQAEYLLGRAKQSQEKRLSGLVQSYREQAERIYSTAREELERGARSQDATESGLILETHEATLGILVAELNGEVSGNSEVKGLAKLCEPPKWSRALREDSGKTKAGDPTSTASGVGVPATGGASIAAVGGSKLSPKKGTTTLVRVRKNRLLTRQPVRFVGRSAKLHPKALPVLDEVASVMREKPGLGKVRVEVHTDNSGSRYRRMRQSYDRAMVIVTYLLGKGVAPDRLLAAGFGPDRPILPNISARNRRLNNRIEFHIVDAKN